jgi:hypothetical protein
MVVDDNKTSVQLFVGALCIVVCGLVTYGQDLATHGEAKAALQGARSIRCVLGDGVSSTWSGGQVNRELARFASDPSAATITFDSIDVKRMTARIVGDIASADVQIVSTNSGLTFLESTPNGPNVTTVYPFFATATSQRFLMVQSRHKVIRTPAPSQYYGTCIILQ